MKRIEQTERTELRRHPERGQFEREKVYEILDEGLVCHVGFNAHGKPYVIPTGYVRLGDNLYFHGAAASRMMTTLGEGLDVCVTVTLLDGLVLARSAFSHSMNYRSVVAFGRARVVEDAREKLEALRAFTEHVVPGRWRDARRPNREELNETTVLALALDEASAKVRTGPPIDKDEDYEMSVWAGVIPLKLTPGEATRDPRLGDGIEMPDYVRAYRRG
jgi:uncharacterized protein